MGVHVRVCVCGCTCVSNRSGMFGRPNKTGDMNAPFVLTWPQSEMLLHKVIACT